MLAKESFDTRDLYTLKGRFSYTGRKSFTDGLVSLLVSLEASGLSHK
jgi:hypothetical protein